MKNDEARHLMEEMFACYPSAPIPGRRIVEAWAPHLRDVEYEDGMTGMRNLVETSRFLPALEELLDACRIARRARFASLEEVDPSLESESGGDYVSFAEWKRRQENG